MPYKCRISSLLIMLYLTLTYKPGQWGTSFSSSIAQILLNTTETMAFIAISAKVSVPFIYPTPYTSSSPYPDFPPEALLSLPPKNL